MLHPKALESPELIQQKLVSIYEGVFRTSTLPLGYCFLDFGAIIDSRTLRQTMVDIKEGLSSLCKARLKQQLNYQSLGRFDHQHTSQFHRDTAPSHSFLMLGYEPTEVYSKVYVADYSRYLEDKHMPMLEYFEGDLDQNTANHSEDLEPYVTEIKPFYKKHFRLLILNNSKAFDVKTYGVFHRGKIPHKHEIQHRIINYMMLNLCELGTDENYRPEDVMDFLNTEAVVH